MTPVHTPKQVSAERLRELAAIPASNPTIEFRELRSLAAELLTRRSSAGVKFKALTWMVNGSTSIWTGELIFGVFYTIYDEGNGFRVFRKQFLSDNETEVAYAADQATAKAAAQDDFNTRIESALEPLPSHAGEDDGPSVPPHQHPQPTKAG